MDEVLGKRRESFVEEIRIILMNVNPESGDGKTSDNRGGRDPRLSSDFSETREFRKFRHFRNRSVDQPVEEVRVRLVDVAVEGVQLLVLILEHVVLHHLKVDLAHFLEKIKI